MECRHRVGSIMSFLLSGSKSYLSKIFLRLHQSEKQSKNGNQRNKKVAKKPSMSKRSTKKTPVASPSDSDSQDQDGIQSKEILSNECAICFGLYQDDLTSTGKLLTEWVKCPNTIYWEIFEVK